MRTSSLPPTFREAVYVARGMGFSHIWIDSLCIIQDDKEDWKAEARRMAIIYDNATYTIVAMDGLDSEAGLTIQNSELKSAGVLDSRAWLGGSTSTSSDKFLAINGITTVAQRWTHLRSSFGLFYHFFETEMLCVVNDMYRRLPMRGSLMIKPEIKMGMGTAFDQPLPFAAWMARRYHTLEMKGDLRKGVVTATPGINGETKYTIALDKLGRFSDEEVHDFRPDCAEEFPVGQSVNVLYMVWYHYDADYWKLDKHIDVGLVFKQMKGETEITMYEEDVAKESTSEQRLLTRLGYLETTYPTGSRRNMAEVMEELTWYFVRVA
ncbi:hypothetical protein K4K52_006450 [Colletotrichum sp. SAR 10_76]|nr:hypothetical protein K4K51_012938 [Colletotrichum sp. SAR 10_75]KAI8202341.1 hypothetical protein K4K52_006450 [Colletotrichum sp. SAR 10_76]